MQEFTPVRTKPFSQKEILALPTAPKAKGMPIVSSFSIIRGFMTDTQATFQNLYSENGPVLKVNAPLRSIVLLMGPDATERVLVNADGAFSSELGWKPFINRVFPGAVMAMDGKEHKFHRGIMQLAFTREPLSNYLDEMNPVINDCLDIWMPNAEQKITLQFYPKVKQLTLDVAASAFMGIELDDEAAKLNQYFVDAVHAALAYIRLPIPPFQMWRGVRGRKELVKKFRELIPEKRAGNAPDLFSRMCHAKSENGDAYSDMEIINHMIFVMMAAHDTSTSTMATMAYLLAKNPEWQDRIRNASLKYCEKKGDPFIDYKTMENLEELGWVVREALRLYPPLTSMPRIVTRDVEINGYRIPKGQLVGVVPLCNHHDPTLWSTPEKFDPERFSPARAEDKNHRYAWTPFGGGMHKCIGQYFGFMEIKATIHLLLQKYKWSIPEDYLMPYQMVPIARPKDALPLHLERIN